MRVGAWFDALDPPAGLRREHRADLHLTVAFFGAITEERGTDAFANLGALPLPHVTVARFPRRTSDRAAGVAWSTRQEGHRLIELSALSLYGPAPQPAAHRYALLRR